MLDAFTWALQHWKDVGLLTLLVLLAKSLIAARKDRREENKDRRDQAKELRDEELHNQVISEKNIKTAKDIVDLFQDGTKEAHRQLKSREIELKKSDKKVSELEDVTGQLLGALVALSNDNTAAKDRQQKAVAVGMRMAWDLPTSATDAVQNNIIRIAAILTAFDGDIPIEEALEIYKAEQAPKEFSPAVALATIFEMLEGLELHAMYLKQVSQIIAGWFLRVAAADGKSVEDVYQEFRSRMPELVNALIPNSSTEALQGKWIDEARSEHTLGLQLSSIKTDPRGARAALLEAAHTLEPPRWGVTARPPSESSPSGSAASGPP
jgi:hypothetical protein